MTRDDAVAVERRAADFSRERLLAARERTWEAVRRIAAAIRPGMLEEDAYPLALRVIEELGGEKNWHRPWIRFGANTVKHCGVLSKSGARLGEDDIFFIDIGPVFDGYAGDAGDSYVTGADPERRRCRDDARRLFALSAARWREGVSGAELFRYAASEAERMGWVFNLKVKGHRISEFPHAVYFRGGIADVEFPPAPDAWIMEIQIRHPSEPFGAFYEDLLFDGPPDRASRG